MATQQKVSGRKSGGKNSRLFMTFYDVIHRFLDIRQCNSAFSHPIRCKTQVNACVTNLLAGFDSLYNRPPDYDLLLKKSRTRVDLFLKQGPVVQN